jgi:hypothetical protein
MCSCLVGSASHSKFGNRAVDVVLNFDWGEVSEFVLVIVELVDIGISITDLDFVLLVCVESDVDSIDLFEIFGYAISCKWVVLSSKF